MSFNMDVDEEPVAGPSTSTGSAAQAQTQMQTNALDFDVLTNLEQHFYDSGHISGYAHGRIHGLIEGRQLGREKGFELWEEVGFYEGFAGFWKAVFEGSEQEGQGECPQAAAQAQPGRALHHISALLSLISRFPTSNPTPPVPDPNPPDHGHLPTPPPEEVDIPALLAQIRARYRALCASLGVKPRMAVASGPGSTAGSSSPSAGRGPGTVRFGRGLAF